MTKTEHFNLNQWEPNDPIRREDFNADNAAVDAALKQVDDNSITRSAQVRSEAADALAAYQTTNDAAVSVLNTAVAAGLKIEMGTYAGSGVCGSANKNTLTFSFPPKIVGIVVDGTAQTRSGIIFLSGQSKSSGAGSCSSSGGTFSLHLTWSGNSVSWYTDYTGMASNQLNDSGYTYRYFAIG